MKQSLMALWWMLSAVSVMAEDKALNELFSEYGVEGTMVLVALNDQQSFVHNEARAKRRFTAASTFKIPNSLIALEEQVVSSRDSVFPWDGRVYGLASWNADQTLDSAFKVSCVWCYQQIAREVGSEKYRSYIDRLSYGVLNDAFELTTFWLDGSLRISALEQIDFLKALYARSLPFGASSFDTLQEIMRVEKNTDFVMRAKTGWGARQEPQVGWYVGYVETQDDVWFFATNIVITRRSDLSLRESITREALQLKGIIGFAK